MRKIAMISVTREQNIPSNKAFYRPIYLGGSTVFYKDTKELVVSEPEGPLQKQVFQFSYQEAEKELASGWFGLNGYNGKAHVEISKTASVQSFAKLQRLLKTVRNFVFQAVATMGALCYRNYLSDKSSASKVTKSSNKHYVADESMIPFVPAVVKSEKRMAAQIGLDEILCEERQTPKTQKARVHSWVRRGCWCTSKLGHKYYRKGGICYRKL